MRGARGGMQGVKSTRNACPCQPPWFVIVKPYGCPFSSSLPRGRVIRARAEPAGSTDIAEVLTENLVDKILLNAIVHQARLDADLNLVTKPFTFDQLAIKVRDVLDR